MILKAMGLTLEVMFLDLRSCCYTNTFLLIAYFSTCKDRGLDRSVSVCAERLAVNLVSGRKADKERISNLEDEVSPEARS